MNATAQPEPGHEAGEHQHGHAHGHDAHDHRHAQGAPRSAAGAEFTPGELVLTIRSHSGLSGDMFLAGLMCMTGIEQAELEAILKGLMPELAGSVRLVRREVNHIGGWHAAVDLPRQHAHRALADIREIIAESGLSAEGRRLAGACFELLAGAEGRVHGRPVAEVRFHEVGALDSVLDICLTCELFARLAPARCIASPLPVADGEVVCAHGAIPVPVPAVLELLPGIPVRPFEGEGETVTPTAAALLRTLGVTFGPWPPMTVTRTALVFGTRVFPHVANGAIFAIGRIY